ncbi:Superfamily II DNA or RNA helicase, SNF2 family [Desulfofustis glycolicus DSM 9705]|uniref:Superfamily II DNA or RNA helicase, SNF2 family n=2 Tax=Desulfofustis glycolicus TaxID=51195 RepID=A0A1M5XBN9_9BACT|nr:Superfamily II DNA or RNA helicase, SNF2 family [Desulfofustis glycolicus DSM 9705]
MMMLVEQGKAEVIPNGFIIGTDVAVRLDRTTKDMLGLPIDWCGSIEADIQGDTRRSNFAVILKIKNEGSPLSRSYRVSGPLLQIGSTQQYALTPAQQHIFGAIEAHRSSEKTEYDNLRLLLALQEGQQAGANINLAHFENKEIKAPRSISIEAERDAAGNLVLTPFMGQNASNERIQRVLGQLESKKATALRVGDEIILFDDKKLEAVHEILKNRIVPQDKVAHFFKNPTAFIDASLVDLEIGFSIRVHGVTKFKHAYFGETDESGIDWFATNTSTASVLPILKLSEYIHDADKLLQFKARLKDATMTGAGELFFEGKYFDISDKDTVTETVIKMERKILEGAAPTSDSGKEEIEKEEQNSSKETAVVDIDLHDDSVAIELQELDAKISDLLYPAEKLDWSNYLRTPFPHQDTGIRWILGLALAEKQQGGGLLADDMGLGKTFMALAAVDQLYKNLGQKKKTKKPCLVVAPLSLVQTWKDEVDQTFSESPFKDIIILQADADLGRFRISGVETKQQLLKDDTTAQIRYSLKVGKKHLPDMLDMPQRLVITTYQTLRDYQFSLCTIDWGMVIFDEAQNIKNPNALQTRAAKGLKADFKLLTTGTPVENSLSDFWCLMDTACPGYLNSYQNFRNNYVLPILEAAGDEIEDVRIAIGRALRLKVGPLMLRRVKEDNLEGLPQKNIFVGIDGEEWQYLPALAKIMKGNQLDIYNGTLKARADSEINLVLSSLQRLRDVSLHPQLADGGTLRITNEKKALQSLMHESGKIQSLLSVLTEIQKRREKCIIFAVNTRLQKFLSIALARYYGLGGPLAIINGDTKAVAKNPSIETRKTIIRDFEERVGFGIIIMSPIAAGVGLTIVGANNVIHLERHWNPAKEAQATDRVYRIGQKKDVNVFVPILHHPDYESFDVNLHSLLSKKTLLKDAVVTAEQVLPNPGGIHTAGIVPRDRITGDDLSRISWQQFEALCAELFLKEFDASNCWLTQSGSDYGADVVLTTKSSGILIQCKHTMSAKYDGYNAIQAVYAASVKYSEELNKQIDSLIFATNAKHLLTNTRRLAEQYKVQIYSHDEIASLLGNHKISYEMVLKRLGRNRYQV